MGFKRRAGGTASEKANKIGQRIYGIGSVVRKIPTYPFFNVALFYQVFGSRPEELCPPGMGGLTGIGMAQCFNG